MYQAERLSKIMEILHKCTYTTVKSLTYELGYSTATINRDLNLLEKDNLVRRNYGGVELTETTIAPLLSRYRIMEKSKSKIGETAAELIKDNETVFIDGSTTTQSIGKYLIKKNNVTVITNNVSLFLYLNERKIKTIILGGELIEPPYFLGGTETEANAMKYMVDKMFFSASGITEDGKIFADEKYEILRRIMLKNSSQAYFLIDQYKVNNNIKRVFADIGKITGVISDFDFSDEVKNQFPTTNFIFAEQN